MAQPVCFEDMDELEFLVTQCGLENVLIALRDVCLGKAERMWETESIAKLWEQDAMKLDKCSRSVNN